jgi:hypothetical protein
MIIRRMAYVHKRFTAYQGGIRIQKVNSHILQMHGSEQYTNTKGKFAHPLNAWERTV